MAVVAGTVSGTFFLQSSNLVRVIDGFLVFLLFTQRLVVVVVVGARPVAVFFIFILFICVIRITGFTGSILRILALLQPQTHRLHSPVIFMVALWNRTDHYIFILFLLLLLWSPYVIGRPYIFSSCFSFFLSFFFPRLISAVGDWMFTILWQMVWP